MNGPLLYLRGFMHQCSTNPYIRPTQHNLKVTPASQSIVNSSGLDLLPGIWISSVKKEDAGGTNFTGTGNNYISTKHIRR
jgi:hypothetical protein